MFSLYMHVGMLLFPAFAAGAICTSESISNFWLHLIKAYSDCNYDILSHKIARMMLDQPQDLGMSCIKK